MSKVDKTIKVASKKESNKGSSKIKNIEANKKQAVKPTAKTTKPPKAIKPIVKATKEAKPAKTPKIVAKPSAKPKRLAKNNTKKKAEDRAQSFKESGSPLRATLSPTTSAMFDLLSDTKSHSKEEVLLVAVAAALREDYNRCIDEGKRQRKGREASLQEYANSGARHFARNNLMIAERNQRIITTGKDENAKCRMPVALARDWAAARERASELQQREPVSVQPFGTITQYNKRPEWEGWAYAPLITQDIAHVRPTLSVPIERLRAAFPGWGVNESSDGLISIGAHPGAPVKEVVTLWFSENELHHDGVRDAKGVRRRNLRELQPAFLEDLVKKSVPFARGLINSRYAASMQRLVGDHDDIEGYTMMWIIELASSFDATLGRPFGTWLTNQIPRKVQDLNRASHGRTASDAEMKHAKGRAEFEGIHGRTPTNEELRNILGLSVEEMRTKRRHLAVLSGLRSSTPLDSGPDDPEIPIVDETANPEKDALAREQSEQITLALLAASGTFDPHLGRPIMTRPLGFLVTYLMTWDDWVKGDLIAMAGCADRKVTEEVELVTEHLAKSLQSLQNSR